MYVMTSPYLTGASRRATCPSAADVTVMSTVREIHASVVENHVLTPSHAGSAVTLPVPHLMTMILLTALPHTAH